MKIKTSKTCIGAIAIALILSFASSGMAQIFLAANVTAKGRYQSTKSVGEDEVNLIKSTPAINAKVLINFATGHEPSTAVPPNLVLALTTCDDQPRLVVFDKLTSNSVVDVGIITLDEGNILNTAKVVCTGSGEDRTCDVVDSAFEGLVTLTFQTTGTPDIGILGGSVQLYVKGNYDSSGECPVKISGTGSGTIDIANLDDGVPNTVHVVLQSFAVSTNKRLTQ